MVVKPISDGVTKRLITNSVNLVGTVPIFSVDIQPTGDRFATAGLDGSVSIWSMSDLRKAPAPHKVNSDSVRLFSFRSHKAPVNIVRWSVNGQYLASGGDDHALFVYNLVHEEARSRESPNKEKWQMTRQLHGHTLNVADLAWCPTIGSMQLCSAGMDRKIIVWDACTGCQLHVFEGQDGFVRSVAWDPLGEYIASQSDDNSVMIWQFGKMKCKAARINMPDRGFESGAFLSRIDWSPNGCSLLFASKVLDGKFERVCMPANDLNQMTMIHQKTELFQKGTISVSRFNPHIYQWKRQLVQYCGCASSKGYFAVLRISAAELGGAADTVVFEEWLEFTQQSLFGQEKVIDISWSADGTTVLLGLERGGLLIGLFTDEDLGTIVSNCTAVRRCEAKSTLSPSASTKERVHVADPNSSNCTFEDLARDRKKQRITPQQVNLNDHNTGSNAELVDGMMTEEIVPLGSGEKKSGERLQISRDLDKSQSEATIRNNLHALQLFNLPQIQSKMYVHSTKKDQSVLVVTNPLHVEKKSSVLTLLSPEYESWTKNVAGSVILAENNGAFVSVATTRMLLQVRRIMAQMICKCMFTIRIAHKE